MRTPVFFLFAFVLCLFVVGCTKDEPVAPEEEPPPAAVTQVIGPGGGRVVAGGFSLAVPAGAFASTETLRVSSEATSPEFGTDAFTPLVRVEGIPVDFSLPLRVDLQADRTPAPGIFLMVGKEALTPFQGETVDFWDDVPSAFSAGVLSAELPVPEGGLGRSAGRPAGPQAEGLESAKWFLGIDNTDTLLSAGGHFRVVYRRYMEGSARSVAAYYEKAFDSCSAAGFDRDGLFQSIAWPFKITIQTLCSTEAPAFEKTGMRPEPITGRSVVYVALDECELVSGTVAINTSLAGSFTSVLGGVQLLRAGTRYPGFNADQRAQYTWLVTSIVHWAQELVLWEFLRPSFVDPEFPPRWRVPFHGLPLPEGFNTFDHGVGWIPLMKHIADSAGGPHAVTAAFHELLDRPNGVDALLSSVMEPEYSWFPAFVRRYVEGSLYGVKADTFLQSVGTSELFTINGSQDTAATFSASYPDLSAKLYRVNLRYPAFSSDASIRFTLGAQSLSIDYVQVLVFCLRGGLLEFRDEGTMVTVTDIRSLRDSGCDLVAAVVNSSSEAPYNGKLGVDLHIQVASAAAARVGMSLCGRGFCVNTGGSGHGIMRYLPGTFRDRAWTSGGVFTAAWDGLYGGATHAGHREVHCDLAASAPSVISFSVQETLQHSWAKIFDI